MRRINRRNHKKMSYAWLWAMCVPTSAAAILILILVINETRSQSVHTETRSNEPDAAAPSEARWPSTYRSVPPTPPVPPPPPSILEPIPGEPMDELVPGYVTRNIRDFTMLISTEVISRANESGGVPFRAIKMEFDSLVKVLPKKVDAVARSRRIVIDWDNKNLDPQHALSTYLYDKQQIHIFSLNRLINEKRGGCSVLLHPIAHIVHSLIVGHDNSAVIFAYNQARERNYYDTPEYNKLVTANEREYFAELSCAYLHRWDEANLTRAGLKKRDPVGHDLMARIWDEAKWPSDVPRENLVLFEPPPLSKEPPKTPAKAWKPDLSMRMKLTQCLQYTIDNPDIRILGWEKPVKATRGMAEGELYVIYFQLLPWQKRQWVDRVFCVFVSKDKIVGDMSRPPKGVHTK
jgi:hypothetical protein